MFMPAVPLRLLICKKVTHANIYQTLNVHMRSCSLFGHMVFE